jgi:hypothetical protein
MPINLFDVLTTNITTIYTFLREQDGKNLQYSCKELAFNIAEIRNIVQPLFHSDIYAEDLNGHAFLLGKPCLRPSGDIYYQKIWNSSDTKFGVYFDNGYDDSRLITVKTGAEACEIVTAIQDFVRGKRLQRQVQRDY